jgi:hypothetical protein
MSIHPGGDNLLLGTFDKKVQWFDLDLSSMPYQVKKISMICLEYVLFELTVRVIGMSVALPKGGGGGGLIGSI